MIKYHQHYWVLEKINHSLTIMPSICYNYYQGKVHGSFINRYNILLVRTKFPNFLCLKNNSLFNLHCVNHTRTQNGFFILFSHSTTNNIHRGLLWPNMCCCCSSTHQANNQFCSGQKLSLLQFNSSTIYLKVASDLTSWRLSLHDHLPLHFRYQS